MSVILGAGLVLVESGIKRPPNSVPVSFQVYEGTQTQIAAAVASLPAWVGLETSNEGIKHRLRIYTNDAESAEAAASSAGTDTFTTRWEIAAQEEGKTVLEHRKVYKFPSEVRNYLRDYILNSRGKTFTEQHNALIGAVAGRYDSDANPIGARIINFFDKAWDGTNYQTHSYVARLTQTAGASFSKQISDVGIEAIYTTSQLISEATTNSTPIPPRLIYKIQQIPSITVATDPATINSEPNEDGYLWGWLKKPSTETEVAGGRIEIQTEWTLGLWSTLLYDIYQA